jgi:hypothetical protein
VVSRRRLLNAATGCAAGAGSLWLIAWIGKAIYKTEAMGLGDVKLPAFTGAHRPDGVLWAAPGCIGGALFRGSRCAGDPHIAFGRSWPGVLLRFLVRRPPVLLVQWPAATESATRCRDRGVSLAFPSCSSPSPQAVAAGGSEPS